LSLFLRRPSDPKIDIVGGDVRIACVDPDKLTALEAYETVLGHQRTMYIERMGFSGTDKLGLKRYILIVFDLSKVL
jgi:hypothetical protein